jgi:hypothetical protein
LSLKNKTDFIYRLIIKGYRKELTKDDLWELDESDCSKELLEEYETEWNKRIEK